MAAKSFQQICDLETRENKTPSLRQPPPPHDNYEFYENCLANDIALFFIPSHATHILQPLDVGVFSLLDRYCSQEVDDWTVSRPLYTSPLKGDFLPMYERARKEGVTAHSIKAGRRQENPSQARPI